MKNIKILAIALSAGIALGAISGCKKRIQATVSSVINTEATTSKATTIAESSENQESSKEAESSSAGNESVKMDEAIQEKANTFVSHFVMQYITRFDRSQASVEEYLDFAHIYLKINSDKSIKNEKKGELNFETFTFTKAREVVGKFFGTALDEVKCKTLTAPPSTYGDQPAGPFYASGKIYYESAAGEGYNNIAVVDSMKNNGDGTFTLYFTEYTIDYQTYEGLDDNAIKKYFKLTPQEAKADKSLERGAKGTAVVDVGQSGDYIMINYRISK